MGYNDFKFKLFKASLFLRLGYNILLLAIVVGVFLFLCGLLLYAALTY